MSIFTRINKALGRRERAPETLARVARVFGVGPAKTGTASIAALFEGSALPSEHEPHAERLLGIVLERAENGMEAEAFSRQLRTIVEESPPGNISQINGYIIADLFSLYPNDRYILTARDAEGWVKSLINHVLTRGDPGPVWGAFRRLRFSRGFPFQPEDRWLEERGLYSLDGLLDYWREHILTVLKTVPERQLLVVPTLQIGARKAAIYAFAGLETDPNEARHHANQGRYLAEPLGLPEAYLHSRCAYYSDSLIRTARTIVGPAAIAILNDALYPDNNYYFARAPEERSAAAERSRTTRSTDIGRWAHVASQTEPRWEGRAALAASMIQDQTSVLDLGCGAMVLERFLPRGATYIPSDCIGRDERTIVVDLNAVALPEIDAVCVAALGLFEYIHDVPGLMTSLARQFEVLICSYIPYSAGDPIEDRRATGWVNDYAKDEFASIIAGAGYTVVAEERYLERACLWRAEKPPTTAR